MAYMTPSAFIVFFRIHSDFSDAFILASRIHIFHHSQSRCDRGAIMANAHGSAFFQAHDHFFYAFCIKIAKAGK